MRIFFFLTVVFSIFSCSKPHQKVLHTVSGLAFLMPYKVIVEGANHPKVQEIIKNIVNEAFEEINSTFNHWNNHSTLSMINKSQSKDPIAISNSFYEILEVAKIVYQLSEGMYDPTLKPLITLWKSSLEAGNEVTENDLSSVSFGFEHLLYTNTQIIKLHPNIELDFDSLIKGYLVDLIHDRLKEHGFSDFFIDWSGDIRASGKHSSNRSWQVGVLSSKNNDAHEMTRIALDNAAIATSGSTTQRWLTTSHEILTHIINPKTKRPIKVDTNRLATVSVKANSCIFADALATAAFTFEDLNSLNNFIDKVKKIHLDVEFIVTVYEKETL